jgi:uncharacterized integral membrane protein (TIGR00698 family)
MKAHLSLPAYLPGLLLCVVIAAISVAGERLESAWFGRAWVEALVLAILLGTAVRTIWTPPPCFAAGVKCAGKTVLEIAVVLMGATISFEALIVAGLPLIAAVVCTVIIAIFASFLLGRIFGLNAKMAVLVACGNGICGNSAIAAVAPVIEADSDDVATAIAFTAVLGIGVVLLIPAIAAALQLSAYAGGILAGLTVYAVPQVLAAAGPMGTTAVQVGTLVKLVRVLMLGPIVTCLALLRSRTCEDADAPLTHARHAVLDFLPPFIIAFLALATLRSLGLLPDALIKPAHVGGKLLTIVAMAGLGLSVDLRSVTTAGPRVTAVVSLSLLILGSIALVALHLIGLAR